MQRASRLPKGCHHIWFTQISQCYNDVKSRKKPSLLRFTDRLSSDSGSSIGLNVILIVQCSYPLLPEEIFFFYLKRYSGEGCFVVSSLREGMLKNIAETLMLVPILSAESGV